MSNFDPSQAINLPKSKLNYNLTYQKDVFYSDIQKLSGANGLNYYKIAHDNDPHINFSYDNLVPTGYSAINFYYFGILHNNIVGLTDSQESLNQSHIVGELVVEYKNSSNPNKVFTCFFLSTAQNPAMAGTNFTDNIIAMIKANGSQTKVANVSLNDDIPTQANAGCFIYKDTNNNANTVVTFLNPIVINPTSQATISALSTADTNGNTPLFSINAPIMQETTSNIGNQTETNGKGDDNIYIDCNPSGESEETIQTYNLPINSELLGEKNQMDVMKTALNFFMFIILILFVYILIPKLYKKVIIDSANIFSSTTDIKPLIRIRSADMWISLAFLITCIILFDKGFKDDDFSALSTAMYLVLIFGLSVTLVQSYKMNEPNFMKTIQGSCKPLGENYVISEDSWKFTSISDFFRTLSDLLVFYVKDVLRVHIALCVVITAFISISNAIQKKPFDINFGNTISTWLVIMFPISFIIRTFM
jgi:hypothetical protein